MRELRSFSEVAWVARASGPKLALGEAKTPISMILAGSTNGPTSPLSPPTFSTVSTQLGPRAQSIQSSTSRLENLATVRSIQRR